MSFNQRFILCLVLVGLLLGSDRPAGAQEEKLEKKSVNQKEKPVPPPVGEPAPFVVPTPVPSPVPAQVPGVVAPTPYGVSNIPSLHYNYYYPAPLPGQPAPEIPARLYLCPRPAPPYVGYVYITYPPFQPHEWLWQHARAYYRFHPGAGITMTSIWWVYEDR
jgi:hypothetical protein